MSQLPFYIPLLFLFTILLSLFIYFRAFCRSGRLIILLSVWLLVQAILGYGSFYLRIGPFFPKFLLLILLPLIFTLVFFVNGHWVGGGRSANLKWLCLIHVLRIPVELVLFGLFIYHLVPQVMTFEGRNFDLVAGLSAPFIYYFGFVRKRWSSKFIIMWNILGLGLLANIMVIAWLSMPTPFQQFGSGQPNIALFYFPFVWLPSSLVPMVLYAHLVTIRQLMAQSRVDSGSSNGDTQG